MKKWLVKEKENIGFVAVSGQLKDNTLFVTDSKHKLDIRRNSKDEKLFDNEFSARLHAEMLNSIAA